VSETASVARPDALSIIGSVRGARTLGPLAGLVILCIIFGLAAPVFLTPRNLIQIVQQVMEVGTLAVGQTLIILTAGIDLSNGAIMVLGSIVMAKLAVVMGIPAPLAILAGLLVTTLLGLCNGLIVALFRVPPFVATLGMLNLAYATTLLYSGQASVDNLPPGLLILDAHIPIGDFPLPIGPLVMLAVIAVMWYLLNQTGWGRHIYAFGNNVEAARLTGINVGRLQISAYLSAGIIYGIAALLVLGRTTVGDPNAGQTDNLDSITAVVIGGTSLFGGRGGVIGTLIGALIVGVLRNGLTLVGVEALWQTFATGIIVIVAVAADEATRRKRA
jgi:fructose transport system permease protein